MASAGTFWASRRRARVSFCSQLAIEPVSCAGRRDDLGEGRDRAERDAGTGAAQGGRAAPCAGVTGSSARPPTAAAHAAITL
jgi:hypothetical protein